MTSVALYLAFLGVLYVERVVELLVSQRNARLAFAAAKKVQTPFTLATCGWQ